MFDKVKSILRTRHERQQDERVEVPKSLVQQIMEAPALFNRRTRRSIGMYGRIWKWDLNASEETRRTFLPRYIRRHYANTTPHTRRQRKATARILRISARYGIGQ
jgi:hypothetical protein